MRAAISGSAARAAKLGAGSPASPGPSSVAASRSASMIGSTATCELSEPSTSSCFRALSPSRLISSASTSSAVTACSPLRTRSRRSSIAWVSPAIWSRPSIPEEPFRVCAARKISCSNSSSSASCSRRMMSWSSMSSRLSASWRKTFRSSAEMSSMAAMTRGPVPSSVPRSRCGLGYAAAAIGAGSSEAPLAGTSGAASAASFAPTGNSRSSAVSTRSRSKRMSSRSPSLATPSM